MEEKGSCEEIGSGSGFSCGLESDAVGVGVGAVYSESVVPSQHGIDDSNVMALGQWMYPPYVPQFNYATNFMAGCGSSSSAGYQQASPPLKNNELKRIASSPTELWKVNSRSPVFNNRNSWFGIPVEAANPVNFGQNVWYGLPQLEEEMQHKVGSESSQSLIQDGISTTDGSGSKNAGAVLDSASTQRDKGKKPSPNYENDRRRRKIISERLKALQELVPQSVPGHPCDLLEDIIDYIKYMQLQLKELSQSRIGGEPVSDPVIYIEGYGHYLTHEPMVNEPLDEIMGRLMEVNPREAAAILESKGLFIRDISLAKGLPNNV